MTKSNPNLFGPDPSTPHPFPQFPRIGFLKNFIRSQSIEVGDYTYYDDPKGAENFETENVLYHYDFSGDRLIVGKFCALATGVKFIMNGANHRMNSFSTYPFAIFGNGWEVVMSRMQNLPHKGDTIVGNDVWIGTNAVILPGVKIGDGAIVGAYSVVARDVPPYTIVAGNPARLIRDRFSKDTTEKLLKLRWWDWSPEKITNSLEFLTCLDFETLEKFV
ncbi:antibiotic acetyltransferase [Leptospira gomenensis]|uniref:Antibiotic acetyltransferase n=1 Tax=Leptospira gomenensis TaxID=2484974 RepID=A0A5F1YDL4_9LEPT|nr:CatB-related O-acetyltransferase [Leptospira gomenensis]TGK36026.1 antibiotic acetyltransferase [Leptospira gomenensis]TGK44442.1 antibiotic acetyltransferase [Leptospira gomenensis]TGK53371.1 antibiotic acetyltransferase [Leptospira gomenensis]TGK60695.1 antibiotic acetyltransferase [Leptospira gomenensis]